MLSILIPTYNYTCYKLVSDLHEQAESLGVAYEILVVEDGSRDSVSIIANHKIEELSHCRHIINHDNQGQAATRNQLARMAVYDWILFIDNDARVKSDDFLSVYLNCIGKADVVVGGLVHPDACADPNRSLRFRYERNADLERGAAVRSQHPYSRFSAFNVMMRRSMFLCIQFDRHCTQYGYEDALFGVELQRRNISILHIDNQLVHTGIDTNAEFLQKTETAMHSLRILKDKMQGGSSLLGVYARFQRRRATWLLRLTYKVFGGLMRRNLLSAHPSLNVFSIWKLCYYASLR